MKTLLFLLLALPCYGQCGKEFIAQKDLTLADTAFLREKAVQTTVKAEGLLPRHGKPVLIELQATIVGYKLEPDDGDFHVCLESDGSLMIAEFPNPDCPLVQSSSQYAKMKAMRAWFIANVGTPGAKMKRCSVLVDLIGVRFTDKLHGQVGAAPNGSECHPVLGASYVRQ